jgi:hypothetical protein
MAQDIADMIEAQNNGIYDAEPRDPDSAANFASGAPPAAAVLLPVSPAG